MNLYLYCLMIQLGISLNKCEIINKGDLYIKNNLKTNICEIVGGEAFLKCVIFKGPLILANSLTTKTILTESIEVHQIYPYNYDYILLNGKLNIEGNVNFASDEMQASSFIETQEIQLNNVKQWFVFHFNEYMIDNQSILCKQMRMMFGIFITYKQIIQGNQLIKSIHYTICGSTNEQILKLIDIKQPYKFLKIETTFICLNQWNNDAAYMKINSSYKWVNHYTQQDGSMDYQQISVIYNNSKGQQESELVLEFGVLQNKKTKISNAQFRIENLQIFIK